MQMRKSKVIMDSVLWGFAQCYHKLYVQEHPKNKQVSIGVIAAGMLQAMKTSGDAEEYEDDAGNSIWKATPKFLANTARDLRTGRELDARHTAAGK
jgi:hypothetical protein